MYRPTGRWVHALHEVVMYMNLARHACPALSTMDLGYNGRSCTVPKSLLKQSFTVLYVPRLAYLFFCTDVTYYNQIIQRAFSFCIISGNAPTCFHHFRYAIYFLDNLYMPIQPILPLCARTKCNYCVNSAECDMYRVAQRSCSFFDISLSSILN